MSPLTGVKPEHLFEATPVRYLVGAIPGYRLKQLT